MEVADPNLPSQAPLRGTSISTLSSPYFVESLYTFRISKSVNFVILKFPKAQGLSVATVWSEIGCTSKITSHMSRYATFRKLNFPAIYFRLGSPGGSA